MYGLAGAVEYLETGQVAKPFFPILISLILQIFSLFEAHKEMTFESVRALPHFAAVLTWSALLYSLPTVLGYFQFIPSGIKPSKPHSLPMIVMVPIFYCIVTWLIYQLVLKPLAEQISISFFGKQQSKVSWAAWKFWILLYYVLVTLELVLLNPQFGYLSIVFTLPFMIVQPTKSWSRLPFTLLLLLSHPIPLLFIIYGIWQTGMVWIIRVMIAFVTWGTLYWPFFALVWIPIMYIGCTILWRYNTS